MNGGFGTDDPFLTFVGTLVFWLAAVTAVTAAAMMVFQLRNMVRAALALTLVLACVAAIYAILGADFLAVVQLAVYIGAIMILMIFAIFMTPRQVEAQGFAPLGERVGAFVVAGLLFATTVFAIATTDWNLRAELLEGSTVLPIGGLLLTRYILPFEIAALVLTVALVGAIVIARED